MADNEMGWKGPITVTALAASGDGLSEPFQLDSFKPEGFFSVQVDLTGDGTLKLEYLVSNVVNPVAADFVTPTGATDIVTAHTKTSGTGGVDLYQFPGAGEPIFAKWVKIKWSETGTADTITFTLWPNVQ